MIDFDLPGLRVGDQLGNLEYVVDDALIGSFGKIAGDLANYPNLVADDCKAILLARVGSIAVNTRWRRFAFLRPPIPGRRIQVGGWLRDAGEDQYGQWLRVSSFAVDDIGTEILRSEAVFSLGNTIRSARVPSGDSCVDTIASSGSLGQAPPGTAAELVSWTLPDTRRLMEYQSLQQRLASVQISGADDGFTELLAARLEGLLTQQFGDDFSWGGQLSLAFHGCGQPGEAIRATATVINSDRDHHGRTHTGLVLGLVGADSRPIATGQATVTSPSPLLD